MTLGATKIYVTVILYFSSFFIFKNILLSFVRNDEQPGLAIKAMLSSSIANIILDYVFMFPLELGMLGAVLATGISPLLSMFILLDHFRRGKSRFGLRKICP